jgi:hypothetical protein
VDGIIPIRMTAFGYVSVVYVFQADWTGVRRVNKGIPREFVDGGLFDGFSGRDNLFLRFGVC